MKRKIKSFTLFLFILFSFWSMCAASGFVTQPAQVSVVSHDDNETVLQFVVGDLEVIPGENGEILYRFPGEAAGLVPQLTRLVAIPADKNVRVEIIEQEFELFDYPVDFEIPNEMVVVGLPAVMRDIRVAPVTVYPVRQDLKSGGAEILKSATIRLSYYGYSSVNNKRFTGSTSGAFDRLYRSQIINYESLDQSGDNCGRGSYLIITPQYYLITTAVEEFAVWKRQKGYNTVIHIIPSSNPNPNFSEIKNIIIEAYESFEPPLEYVLLVGDVDGGSYHMPSDYIVKPGGGENDPTDHPYSLLEGDDYFSDIFVGRASVSILTEATNVFNKFRKYEAEPYMNETDWYRQAMCVGGNHSDGNFTPITPCQTVWWIADHLRLAGYTQVDTICYWRNGDPTYPATDEIIGAINDGRTLAFYRGWSDQNGWEYPVFRIEDIGGLDNDWMLPVMGSFVCNTGNFAYPGLPGCFGEELLRYAETPSNPGGVVAFVGPSDLHTNTNYNNAISSGFVQSVIEDDITMLGSALAAAKMHLYEGFPHQQGPNMLDHFYFHVYNILGEPSLDIWTDIPEYIDVSHVSSLPVGVSHVEISVTHSGAPLTEAYATVVQEGELLAGDYTDSDGTVVLSFAPLSAGSATLTITKHNYHPYIAGITVASQEYVGYYADSLIAETVADNALNPGETATLQVTAKNFGNSTASSVTGTLSCDNQFVSVVSPSGNFGNIASGATAAADFDIVVDEDAPPVDDVTFSLQTTGGYLSKFDVPFSGFDLDFIGYTIQGGPLQPGVESDLVVTIMNNSNFSLENLWITLDSYDEDIQIIDGQANFGTIAVGNTGSNSSNPFRIKPLSGIWNGRMIQMMLQVDSNQPPVYFDLLVGNPYVTDPTGPDPYGYFAYDDGDIGHSKRPDFNWVELDPNYSGDPGYLPGATLASLSDDSNTTVTIPFDFKFYGEEYDILTICSNGWVSLGETWMTNFRNWDIPSPLGPPNMIMPFWDDLKDTTDGIVEVYYLYDQAGGRFIVEWSRAPNRYSNAPDIEETFEVILFDPAVQSGPTGDGDILFQYLVVNDVDIDNNYCTVGITDLCHQRALQYVFSKHYAQTSDTLRDEMAILITTQQPDHFTGVENPEKPTPSHYRLRQNYPNPFNPATEISFEIAETGWVELSVFDLNGRLITTLAAAEMMHGSYSYTWNGRDYNGKPVSSGIYFASLKTDNYAKSIKMVMMK